MNIYLCYHYVPLLLLLLCYPNFGRKFKFEMQNAKCKMQMQMANVIFYLCYHHVLLLLLLLLLLLCYLIFWQEIQIYEWEKFRILTGNLNAKCKMQMPKAQVIGSALNPSFQRTCCHASFCVSSDHVSQ